MYLVFFLVAVLLHVVGVAHTITFLMLDRGWEISPRQAVVIFFMWPMFVVWGLYLLLRAGALSFYHNKWVSP